MRHSARSIRRSLATALLFVTSFAAFSESNGLVILLTDYGTDSIYVGLLKGAIYTKAPNAKIDSITNAVPPFDVTAGAYLIDEGCITFPKGTIFCCIVDPGVGTARRPIVMTTRNGYTFVGPDNGIFTIVAERYGVAEIRQCSNESLWRAGNVSTTFHGRDIFGPVAGALASGTPLDQVGTKLETLTKLDLPKSRIEDKTAKGEVIRADVYGNLVTSIRADDLQALDIRKGDKVVVTIGDQRYGAPVANTYGDVPKGDRLVVLQSAGFVELAINMGSLADAVKQGLHAKVTLKKADATP